MTVADADLTPFLASGEKILWRGRPTGPFRPDRRHLPLLFLVPFFSLFLILPIVGIITDHSRAPKPSDSTAMSPAAAADTTASAPAPHPDKHPVLGAIVVLMFLVCFAGFFISMFLPVADPLLARSKTSYVITNRRVMTLVAGRRPTVRVKELGAITDATLELRPDGSGRIAFNPRAPWPSPAWMYQANLSLSFDQIPNAAEAFRIYAQAAQELKG